MYRSAKTCKQQQKMISSPNMSDDTGVLKMSPVNSHVVCLASIPDVPSKTCERKLDVLKH